MIDSKRLATRVFWLTSSFSFGAAALLSFALPYLLLINDALRSDTSLRLFILLLVGGAVSVGACLFRLRYHRAVIDALAADASAKDARAAESSPEADSDATAALPISPLLSIDATIALFNEPSRMARTWVFAECSGLLLLPLPLVRPGLTDLTTAVSVAVLAALVVATASLPLLVLIRRNFLEVIERAPLELMNELMARGERSPSARGRINRRIVAAVTMPVVFVAFGSALIVNAHLRRDDERSRPDTGRILARAAFESIPGDQPGLERALERASELGFPTQLGTQARHTLTLEPGGTAELNVPLDSGSARVHFAVSTVGVLGLAPVVIALLAAIGAALLGYLMGHILSVDLYHATRGVRMLGTNPGLGATGAGIIQRARLRVVAELFEAIEELADRFAIFAQAQEDAIFARAAATRTRGLFFASVSHDLKAPLNSILGFTQLVSLEPLTEGQLESLQAIHSRARELLALIETILDAARVEEGQLSLAYEEVSFATLYEGAMLKANDLCGDYRPQVFEEFDPHIPPLLIDRAHTQRAFATLLAYSVRTHRGGKMWVRAERESPNRLRIDIDVPSPEHSSRALEGMLSTHTEVERREHRGLSLGLRLAQAIVKLHSGTVRVLDRGKKGAMFCFTLPTVSVPLPIASSPAHSVPPPPSGRAMPTSYPPPMSGAEPGFADEEPPSVDIPAAPRVPQTSPRPRKGPLDE